MTQPTDTKTDGAAAARYAVGKLGVALCAETTTTTMAEDAAKVDVKFTFRHVVAAGKLITAHAQIKAGPSYRQSSNEQFLTLGINKETLQALSGTRIILQLLEYNHQEAQRKLTSSRNTNRSIEKTGNIPQAILHKKSMGARSGPTDRQAQIYIRNTKGD